MRVLAAETDRAAIDVLLPALARLGHEFPIAAERAEAWRLRRNGRSFVWWSATGNCQR